MPTLTREKKMSKETKELILMVVMVIVLIAVFAGSLYLGLSIHKHNDDLAVKVVNTKGVENGNYERF